MAQRLKLTLEKTDIRNAAYNSTFANMAGLVVMGTFCFYQTLVVK